MQTRRQQEAIAKLLGSRGLLPDPNPRAAQVSAAAIATATRVISLRGRLPDPNPRAAQVAAAEKEKATRVIPLRGPLPDPNPRAAQVAAAEKETAARVISSQGSLPDSNIPAKEQPEPHPTQPDLLETPTSESTKPTSPSQLFDVILSGTDEEAALAVAGIPPRALARIRKYGWERQEQPVHSGTGSETSSDESDTDDERDCGSAVSNDEDDITTVVEPPQKQAADTESDTDQKEAEHSPQQDGAKAKSAKTGLKEKVANMVDLKTVGTVAAATAVGFVVAPVIVAAAGFGAAGVTAGSAAAWVQSAFLGGTIVKGSAFAVLQSYGAVGIPITVKVATTAVGIAGSKLVGRIIRRPKTS